MRSYSPFINVPRRVNTRPGRPCACMCAYAPFDLAVMIPRIGRFFISRIRTRVTLRRCIFKRRTRRTKRGRYLRSYFVADKPKRT